MNAMPIAETQQIDVSVGRHAGDTKSIRGDKVYTLNTSNLIDISTCTRAEGHPRQKEEAEKKSVIRHGDGTCNWPPASTQSQ